MPNEAQSQSTECCADDRVVDTAPDPFLLLAILAFGLWLYSRRNLISGIAKVTSGNRLIVGKHKIRIYAIYGLFPGQPWKDRSGVVFNGGGISKTALTQKIDGKKVKCWHLPKEKSSWGAKICRVYLDGEDVGEWMVRNGHAVADLRPMRREVYFRAEKRARKERIGIHQGEFDHPFIWYRRRIRELERITEIINQRDLDKLKDDGDGWDETFDILLKAGRMLFDGGAGSIFDGIEAAECFLDFL